MGAFAISAGTVYAVPVAHSLGALCANHSPPQSDLGTTSRGMTTDKVPHIVLEH